MKEVLKIGKNIDMELIYLKKEIYMMETIMKIKKMLMEFIIGIMEIYMKENIKW